MKKLLYILILGIILCTFASSDKVLEQGLAIRNIIWAVLTLVLFFAISCQVTEKKIIITSPIFWVYLGFLVVNVISLRNAANITEGYYVVGRVVVALVFLYAISTIGNKEVLIKSLVLIAYSISLYGVIVLCHREHLATVQRVIYPYLKGCIEAAYRVWHYVPYNEHFTVIGSSRTGFMSNRNLWSSAQLLLLPFCLYGLKFPKWRYLCITTGALLLFNIVMLMTRSVWLALAVSSVVTLTILVFHNVGTYIGISTHLFYNINIFSKTLRIRRIIFRKYPIRIALLALSLLVVIGSFITFRGYKTIYYHAIGTDSIIMRFETWGRTLKMCRDNLWGVGAGNWKINIAKYGNEYSATSPEGIVRSERFMRRPHNDPLWVLSETGVIGFGLYATIFIMSLYYAYRQGNMAIFFGILCYMGFAFFSFPMERVFHSMILLVMISMVIPVKKMICLSPKLIYVTGVTVTVLLMMTAALYTIGYRSEVMMRKIIVLRGRKNWQQIINTIDSGYSRLATTDPILVTPIIFYRAEAYLYLRNARQSFEDFKKAYQINPYHIYAIENLATGYALHGQPKKAIELYEKVLEITPSFEVAQKNIDFLRGKL